MAGPSSLAYSSLFQFTCVSETKSVEVMRSNFSVVRAYEIFNKVHRIKQLPNLYKAQTPRVATKASLIVHPSSTNVRPLYFLSHVRCLSLEKREERAVLQQDGGLDNLHISRDALPNRLEQC